MRKFMMFLMVLALAFTFAVPAFAFENIFGGYWRTRMYMDKNFTGEDETEAADVETGGGERKVGHFHNVCHFAWSQG